LPVGTPPINLVIANSKPWVERSAENDGVELEVSSRRERSGSLLPKSRAKPRDLMH